MTSALTPLSNFYIAFKVFYHTERQSDETSPRSLEKLPRSRGIFHAELLFQPRKFLEYFTQSGHSLTRGVTWTLLNTETFQEAMHSEIKFLALFLANFIRQKRN